MTALNPYSFVHRLEYLLVRLLFFPVRLIPIPASVPLARLVGWLAFYLFGSSRKLALANINLALGDKLSEKEQTDAVQWSFQNIAMTVVEMVHFRALGKVGAMADDYDATELHRILDARPGGRGVLIVCAHIGNWELGCLGVLHHGLPFCGVARPLPNGYVDDYLTAQRESCGQRIVKKRGALREMLKELKTGSALGFLVDQNARSHGVLVDFFGHPCSTVPTAASLAMKLKVPLVLGACYRIGNRTRFRLVVLPPLQMVNTGDRQVDLVTNTQAMTDMIEQLIRRDPKQWMWIHDRWRLKDSWFAKGGRLASQAESHRANKQGTDVIKEK